MSVSCGFSGPWRIWCWELAWYRWHSLGWLPVAWWRRARNHRNSDLERAFLCEATRRKHGEPLLTRDFPSLLYLCYSIVYTVYFLGCCSVDGHTRRVRFSVDCEGLRNCVRTQHDAQLSSSLQHHIEHSGRWPAALTSKTQADPVNALHVLYIIMRNILSKRTL